MEYAKRQDLLASTRESTGRPFLTRRITNDKTGAFGSIGYSEERQLACSLLSFTRSFKPSISSFGKSMASSGLSASFRGDCRSDLQTLETILPDFELVSKICMDPVEDTLVCIDQTSDEDLHFRLDKGRSLLMYAVLREEVDITQKIVKRVPAMLEWRDHDQRTALHHCSLRGKLISMQCLLDLGASSSPFDSHGRTPLHYAALNNWYEMMLLLLAKGADIRAVDSFGNCCLSYMAEGKLRSDLSKQFDMSTNKQVTDRKRTLLNRVAIRKDNRAVLGRRPTEDVLMVEQTSYKKRINEKRSFNKEAKSGSSQTGPGWIIDDFLARGNFGNVYCGRRQGSQELVALKEYSKRQMTAPELTKRLLNEKNACAQIDSPFVVKSTECFQTPKKLFLVQEYYSKGDLGKYIQMKGSIVEKQLKILAAELILAIESIHKENFIHRDLKPDNILIGDSGHVVVADFGLSTQLKDSKFSCATTFCGTLCYLPPEITERRAYGKSVDWYLLGELLYECAFGTPPYFDPCKSKMRVKLQRCHLQFPATHRYSTAFIDLLTLLLKKDPASRLGSKYGASEVKRHHFFLGIDWHQVSARRIPLFDPSSLQSKKLKDLGQLIMPISEDASNFKILAGWSQ